MSGLFCELRIIYFFKKLINAIVTSPRSIIVAPIKTASAPPEIVIIRQTLLISIQDMHIL